MILHSNMASEAWQLLAHVFTMFSKHPVLRAEGMHAWAQYIENTVNSTLGTRGGHAEVPKMIENYEHTT